MRRLALAAVVICLLAPLCLYSQRQAVSGWEALPRPEILSVVVPAPVVKLFSLEFDGLAADFMFLEAMVFWGRIMERPTKASIDLRTMEFEYLNRSIASVVDLDPYFIDPVLLAQAVLTWEGKMYDEVNTLWEKSMQYRDWDWEPPFYRGFNYFYFLKDYGRASESLQVAALRPTAFPLLDRLATRLAVKGKRTENAIIFIDQMLRKEEDPERRAEYELRLIALKNIYFLEQVVARYVAVKGGRPASLRDLVAEHFISEMPQDPYGGIFYITPEGEIRTTSNMRSRE